MTSQSPAPSPDEGLLLCQTTRRIGKLNEPAGRLIGDRCDSNPYAAARERNRATHRGLKKDEFKRAGGPFGRTSAASAPRRENTA